MTDQERMAQIDALLERVWQTHRELERLYFAELNAYEEITIAQEKNDQGRMPALRRAFDAAHKKTAASLRTHTNNVKALIKPIYEWSSPGRECARFRDQAFHLMMRYVEETGRMQDEHNRMANDLK